ncbi:MULTISPECIES: type II toxin-antitoxin system VapC family toxin [unclassified Treponema]|uniref:type II toxin-antitoxin system tRNA(fMet)-specific endonuclease VapC n=1 Tax=unclassified Treponema TaxID=2638727 RepID=UPI0021128C69|nr:MULTISPECIES: type II toxin-antitoxin system VapC family toxin [unclassified Treponema]UTC67832.1 type II toxin-antitoxin system VapC family toxin [Treponema sp. OMZ 789]UTC70557.1 type II toxin-antitoxin system VapC family toxin [Treponema sp. OMZ 790]UTC73270.1 type II toxin-antitoxin system VapC family toxin [Treponema sp. OMZ 791]
MYFIDTNTCIYFMNGKFPSVRERFLSVSPKEIKISSVVKGELLLGAFKSRTREKTTEKVEKFLKPFEIVDFTDKMSYEYAKIRKDLELAGTPIGANDLLIAAAAVYQKATLITHNVAEFSRVTDLKIEDWVEE